MLRLLAALFLTAALHAQPANPAFPDVLPGKGLAQHDFLYAGEQKQHRIFIVRNGQVAWSYIDENSRGEISDAILRSNGNILFAHQYGITEISRDKKVVWHLDAPQGTEIHTAQPIGKGHIVYVQNGNPALLRVIHTPTNKITLEFPLIPGKPASVHGQFRHARLTKAGTILIAHMDAGKVVEYDSKGAEVWSHAIESPWSADRLDSGNTLIATNRKLVREVDPQGRTVWELTPADIPGYQISGFQVALRLPNGNTLVNNWVNEWSAPIDPVTAQVQVFEFTPSKQLVWAMRSWLPPAAFGPSTILQPLETAASLERRHFGSIR